MEDNHVIWIGIDPNLLLGGLDTKAMFGCDNYLKFNMGGIPEDSDNVPKEESAESDEDVKSPMDDEDVKEDPDENIVKDEVPSDDENPDEVKFTQEQDMCPEEMLQKMEPQDFEPSAFPSFDEGPSQVTVKKEKGKRDHSKKIPSLKCERCKKTFCLIKSFRRHLKYANCIEKGDDYVKPSLRPALCPHCGSTFVDRSSLRKHIKVVHLKEKNHRCDQCDQCFVDRTNLIRHIETKHLETTHFCEFCPRTFTATVYLKEHVKRQHSDTTVACPNCQKNFIKQKNLDLHLLNGICDEIRVEFQKEKKRMKSKERSILCPHCPMVMASHSKMKRHVDLVHIKGTGMSPQGKSHKCIHCEFHTPFEKKLQKHMDVMHPTLYNPYKESS